LVAFNPNHINSEKENHKELTGMYFGHYGWSSPFFGRNLMAHNLGCSKSMKWDGVTPIEYFTASLRRNINIFTALEAKVVTGALIDYDDFMHYQ